MTSTRKTYPPVVVVDENDTLVGTAMLAEVWRKGLYHRIVSVFVLDEQGRMLLQLRGQDVKMYPNCWDPAAGGHVDEGFTYDQTAKNELAEELGIRNIPLRTLGTLRNHDELEDGRIVNQFERVYVAEVPADTTFVTQVDEISKVQWFTPTELKELLSQRPEHITPGLLSDLHSYFPTFVP